MNTTSSLATPSVAAGQGLPVQAARWYFDVVSPFSYLQMATLGRFAGRLQIEYCPVLFAGLLKHWGQLGPAEIPGKRNYIFRYCTWLARRHGIPFRMPPRHPFNPLAALRLIVALGADAAVVKTVFEFIFAEGRDLAEPQQWQALTARLGVADADALIAAPAVKQRLLDNTNAAIAQGVFGVPTMVVRGQLFWGYDSGDMLEAFLSDPALFDDAEMRRLAELPVGASRRA